ncbi:MAG: hypothetical protein ACE1ZO_00870, partial [Nitrospirales bacterium]
MLTQRGFLAFIALLGVSGLVLFESNAADVFLETKRSEFQKIPIWVMGFGDGKAGANAGNPIGTQMADILKADLTRSQVFEVMDEPMPAL